MKGKKLAVCFGSTAVSCTMTFQIPGQPPGSLANCSSLYEQPMPPQLEGGEKKKMVTSKNDHLSTLLRLSTPIIN
jgi:hypothetical protein